MQAHSVSGTSVPATIADARSTNEYKKYAAALSRLRVNLSDFQEVIDFHRDVARALLGVDAPVSKLAEYTSDANRWANIIDDLLKRRPELVSPNGGPAHD